METILESYNYCVVTADSADNMIDQLRQTRIIPDAIVSDYRLRNNELGDEAVKNIRGALGQQTPALIVTGDTSPQRVLEASQSGLALLHKPVTPSQLMHALNALFKDARTTT